MKKERAIAAAWAQKGPGGGHGSASILRTSNPAVAGLGQNQRVRAARWGC